MYCEAKGPGQNGRPWTQRAPWKEHASSELGALTITERERERESLRRSKQTYLKRNEGIGDEVFKLSCSITTLFFLTFMAGLSLASRMIRFFYHHTPSIYRPS